MDDGAVISAPLIQNTPEKQIKHILNKHKTLRHPWNNLKLLESFKQLKHFSNVCWNNINKNETVMKFIDNITHYLTIYDDIRQYLSISEKI